MTEEQHPQDTPDSAENTQKETETMQDNDRNGLSENGVQCATDIGQQKYTTSQAGTPKHETALRQCMNILATGCLFAVLFTTTATEGSTNRALPCWRVRQRCEEASLTLFFFAPYVQADASRLRCRSCTRRWMIWRRCSER